MPPPYIVVHETDPPLKSLLESIPESKRGNIAELNPSRPQMEQACI